MSVRIERTNVLALDELREESSPRPHLEKEEKKARLSRTARLQLILPEASVDRLEKLKAATEAASYAEVIRRSLRLYEALVTEQRGGSVIAIRRKGGAEVQLSLDFLGL
jgi:hypothetical protein